MFSFLLALFGPEKKKQKETKMEDDLIGLSLWFLQLDLYRPRQKHIRRQAPVFLSILFYLFLIHFPP